MKKLEVLAHDSDEHKPVIASGDNLTIRLHYECLRDVSNLFFGVRVYSHLGTLVTEANTWSSGFDLPMVPRGQGAIDLDIDFLNLMPGTYRIGVWASSFAEWHDVLDNCAALNVETSDYYGSGRGIEARFGLVFLPCSWRSPATSKTITPIAETA